VHRFLLVLTVAGSLLSFSACQPTDYTATAPDTLNTRFYCNDPEAVNYNWGFPGRPDSSICRYPSDYFSGTFSYFDSIYLADGKFDSAGSLRRYMLSLQGINRRQFSVSGFCAGGSLLLTGSRYFTASFDTTTLRGQPFCRMQDTISGTITRRLEDTTRLRISFTVVSDTGTATHRGTAYRVQ
jgi:hypothetical protein